MSVDRARLAHWTSLHGRNRRHATTDRKFPRVSFGPARILDAGRHDTRRLDHQRDALLPGLCDTLVDAGVGQRERPR